MLAACVGTSSKSTNTIDVADADDRINVVQNLMNQIGLEFAVVGI